MSLSEDVHDDLASFSMEAMPYKTFLSNLSETSPDLQIIQSLSSGLLPDIDGSVVISTFSLLLSALRVPGSCDLLYGKLSLGHGAQFNVFKQRVSGLVNSRIANSRIAVPTLTSDVEIAAIKMPKFLLDGQQELGLSSPGVSRQVRNMILEITALCHPSLRDHRNIVDLWGWGISEETELRVPFLALEVATDTLATFLCESRSAPIALKHHIALDVGCGLDALHEIGLIHGDLKPENVLLFYKAGHWVAKLADFSGGADTSHGGSLEGRGTVGWRAPELRCFFENGTHIHRSLLDKIDNYSYGLLLWSLFLKENGSAPCIETVEAEMVALLELETNPMSLSVSLRSALKSSFSLLLKQDPRTRTQKVEHLLDDGSRVYSEWMLLKSSRSETFSPADVRAVTLAEENDIGYDWEIQGDEIRYDWEIPEISMDNFAAVRSAFSRNEPMTTAMIQSLFMKCAGHLLLVYKQDFGEASRLMNLMLDLLYTGSKKGSQPLRALIYIVHEHFQIVPRADLYESKLLWMSEAVASGAFFLRKSLQYLDSCLLAKSVQTFQDHGGYNQFYAEIHRETISDILVRTSAEDITHLNWKTSLNLRGDKLLHILSSTTAFKELGNYVKLMSPQELNTLNDCGETALYRACMAGATANVLLLLSQGADPSIAPSRGGPTCLHWLFHFSPQEVDVIASELVTHGALIHSRSEWQLPMFHYPFALPVGTPLHWAVENSAVQATRSLLSQGADPSIRDGSDPYAYDENVRFLDMRLPPDGRLCSFAKRTTLGFNAIDMAVKNRDHEILNILLSNSTGFDPADTDEEGYSAVHRLDAGEWLHTVQGSAVWCRFFQGPTVNQADSLKKTVAVLLQHGFKLDGLTNQKKVLESGNGFSGQTALMIAVANGNTETIKQLLDAGADVNVTNSEGETALLSFTQSYRSDDDQQSKAVSLLLDANANLHSRNSSNCTPLLRAASSGLLEVATALLNHGADLRDRRTDKASLVQFGKTALALVIRGSGKGAAKHDEWLVNQLNTHILPLIAATEGLALHKELLERLDYDGGTLLHYTARYGLIRSCVISLEAKVSINSICRRTWAVYGGRKVIGYNTALDEALDGERSADNTDTGYRTPQVTERAKYKAIFHDIVKLLRDAGGVEARHLIAKHFNMLPEPRETAAMPET